MIAILDSGAANIRSVENALQRIGEKYFVSDNPVELERADKIIFPGVGHATSVMRKLREKKLDSFLRNCQKSVFGICLGMQLLFTSSEEGNTQGLGIFDGRVRRFDPAKCPKIPHVGWNSLKVDLKNPLFQNLPNEIFVYFVHSYFVPVWKNSIAQCEYGDVFSAAVQRNNFYGVQFHPEKSGEVGEQILKNFCNLA